jgi:beta-lactamase class D
VQKRIERRYSRGANSREELRLINAVRCLAVISSVLTAIALSSCIAGKTVDSETNSVQDIFLSEGISGTFVAASLGGDTIYVHNAARSIERFSPASTFKIPNTLIALDSQIVESESSTFTWDGTDRGIEKWNKNQTLETAFKVSCVWCFQEIAREVGVEGYESALSRLDYGSQNLGKQIDSFWLNGSLEISAVEQIAFLRKLYNYDLPFRREHVDILRQIMIVQTTQQHVIYAKTGWAGTEPQVAWYVGFVETSEGTWLFAMNMRVDHPEQAMLREELSLRSLRALGII